MRHFTPIILGLAALACPLASPNGSAAGSEGRCAGDHPDSRLRQQQRQERKRLDEQRRRHGDRPWQGRGYVPYRAPGVRFGPSAQVPRSRPPHPRRGMTLQTGNGFYLRLGVR